jgi:hypothetical protein
VTKTKEEFTSWLQEQMNEAYEAKEIGCGSGVEWDAGNLWRSIEEEEMLDEIGVKFAMDHQGHDIIFECSDGLLASGFETGIEDETIWIFCEFDVTNNLRDYTKTQLDRAIGHAKVAVMDLEAML